MAHLEEAEDLHFLEVEVEPFVIPTDSISAKLIQINAVHLKKKVEYRFVSEIIYPSLWGYGSISVAGVTSL